MISFILSGTLGLTIDLTISLWVRNGPRFRHNVLYEGPPSKHPI
jgi:hypothetical protein